MLRSTSLKHVRRSHFGVFLSVSFVLAFVSLQMKWFSSQETAFFLSRITRDGISSENDAVVELNHDGIERFVAKARASWEARNGRDLRPFWPTGVSFPNFRVFVYFDKELNFMAQFRQCMAQNPSSFLEYKHSEDAHFGMALTSESFIRSPWFTTDPDIADVFVVPGPFGTILTKRKILGELADCLLGSRAVEDILIDAVNALLRKPHFERTKRRHLFVAASVHFRGEHLEVPDQANPFFDFIHGAFEGLKRRNKKAEILIPVPYVALNCLNNSPFKSMSEIWKAWGSETSASSRKAFFFRGQIDSRDSYELRKETCSALGRLAQEDGASCNVSSSVCCSAPQMRTQKPIYNSPCQKGVNMIECVCETSTEDFCSEMLSSTWSLSLPGDTPVSTRLWDALRHGALSARMDTLENVLPRLSPSVPWEKIFVVPLSNSADIEKKLKYLIGWTQAEKRRHRFQAMFEYSAVQDWWAFDGLPTSLWILRDAVNRIRCKHNSTT